MHGKKFHWFKQSLLKVRLNAKQQNKSMCMYLHQIVKSAKKWQLSEWNILLQTI